MTSCDTHPWSKRIRRDPAPGRESSGRPDARRWFPTRSPMWGWRRRSSPTRWCGPICLEATSWPASEGKAESGSMAVGSVAVPVRPACHRPMCCARSTRCLGSAGISLGCGTRLRPGVVRSGPQVPRCWLGSLRRPSVTPSRDSWPNRPVMAASRPSTTGWNWSKVMCRDSPSLGMSTNGWGSCGRRWPLARHTPGPSPSWPGVRIAAESTCVGFVAGSWGVHPCSR